MAARLSRSALIGPGPRGSFPNAPERVPPKPKQVCASSTDVRNREIDAGSEVDDDGVLQVLGRGIKQRKDASEQMRGAGRDELADQEDAQAAILSEYLPEAMGEDEVRALVRSIIESGVTEMGPLMGRLMPELRGRFDGKEANRIVREELAG